MKKKLVLISTSLLSSIPLTVAVSCSNDNNKKPGDKIEDTMKPGDKKDDSKKPGDKKEDSKKPDDKKDDHVEQPGEKDKNKDESGKDGGSTNKNQEKIKELETNLEIAKKNLDYEKQLYYYTKFFDFEEEGFEENLKSEISDLKDIVPGEGMSDNDIKELLESKKQMLEDFYYYTDTSLDQLKVDIEVVQEEIDSLSKAEQTTETKKSIETLLDIKDEFMTSLIDLQVYNEYKGKFNGNLLDNEDIKDDAEQIDADVLLDDIKSSLQAIEELTQDIAKLKQKLQQ